MSETTRDLLYVFLGIGIFIGTIYLISWMVTLARKKRQVKGIDYIITMKYCPNCGESVGEGLSCGKCRFAIDKYEINKKGSSNVNQDGVAVRPQSNAIKGIVILIMFVLSTLYIINQLTNNNSNNDVKVTTPISRAANNGDISIASFDINLSLNIVLVITAKEDINSLGLAIVFMSSNNSTLSSKERNLGNVSKSTNTRLTFSIGEFSLTEFVQINKVSVSVISGTVWF